MLAGPEVGDHFTLNLYDKMIPSPTQIKEYWGFLQNFFLADIFFSCCIRVFAKKKKRESDF